MPLREALSRNLFSVTLTFCDYGQLAIWKASISSHHTVRQSAAMRYLVKVEGALHELGPEGVLLLIGVQLAVAVQETLWESAKGFPEGEIVPV